ncbi:MAG TPA: putative metal-dependent hydrolase [Balneolaceae bacterium]
MDKLKYPIGQFSYDESAPPSMTKQWIKEITLLPRRLSDLVYPLNKEQLNTPYREGGWTILQVIHHLADSHMNAYIRMKLALTEDNPTIKPYDQDKWAELADYKIKMDDSMELIYGLHKRWARVLHSLKPEQIERTFEHPESGTWTIRKLIAQYAWHSNHHLAHIRTLKEQKNW